MQGTEYYALVRDGKLMARGPNSPGYRVFTREGAARNWATKLGAQRIMAFNTETGATRWLEL